jgi:hypothetical protein
MAEPSSTGAMEAGRVLGRAAISQTWSGWGGGWGIFFLDMARQV